MTNEKKATPQIILGPADIDDRNQRQDRIDTCDGTIYYVPRTAGELKPEELADIGQAFGKDDLEGEPVGFLKTGVVSSERTAAILFCDLKNSTSILRSLGAKHFRQIQNRFVKECLEAVKEANKRIRKELNVKENEPPRVIMDKFTGDGAMMILDCGKTKKRHHSESGINSSKEQAENEESDFRQALVARLVVQIVRHILEKTPDMKEAGELARHGLPRLGMRCGVAHGDNITLSVLGYLAEKESPRFGSFTATGEIINLAARLEHATPAEFLEAIAGTKYRLDSFTRLLNSSERAHGSTLGNAVHASERQVLDLYDVCEKRFEIRANERFRYYLEYERKPEPGVSFGAIPKSLTKKMSLAWKKIPFTPKGFALDIDAYLIGGDTVDELLRPR